MSSGRRIVRSVKKCCVFLLLTALCSLLTVLSCQNPFELPKTEKPAENKGYFSLAINQNLGRTILPTTVQSDFSQYKLEFFTAGTTTNPVTTVTRNNTNLSDSVELDAGTYDLRVSAYMNEQIAAQENMSNIVISAGETVTRNVTLRPITGSGTGTFRWNISFENSDNVAAATMTITPLNTAMGTAAQTIDLKSSPNSTATLNSGYYRVVFKLFNNEGLSIERREFLHIYQNMESAFACTFKDNQFKEKSSLTIVINVPNNAEWNLIEQAVRIEADVDHEFLVEGTYSEYQWYLDGELVETESTYTFNQTLGVYELALVVTNSAGEKRSVSCRVTVTAEGVVDTVTVRFYLNGATSGTPPLAQTVSPGDSITLPGDSGFSRTGYTFAGWNTNSSGTGTNFGAGSSYTPTGDITLYARWWNSESIYGAFSVTCTNSTGIAYTSPYLTITQSGDYHITGNGETTDRIRVVGGNITADIVLNDVNINVSDTDDVVAFDANANNDQGVTVNLTIQGTNTLRSGNNKAGLHVPSDTTLVIDGIGSLNAAGGDQGAGVGGNNSESAGTITINNGNVTATGGQFGAGIGGAYRYSAGGTINITGGTVTAIGGYDAAGIGGGPFGAGGTISISGGMVTATGVQYGSGIGGGSWGIGGTISITGGMVIATGYDSPGIGGGNTGTSGSITAITGNAVIFASSIQPALPTDENLGPAIVFNGNDGNLYGNFTLWRDITIDEARTLIIPSDGTLTIGSWTLQNNGTINVTSGGTINGTVSGNQPNITNINIREVTIAMWDSLNDGWDNSAALRINVNGTDLSTNASIGNSPGYRTFTVNSGDVVQIYWVNGGQYDYEIAFAVYYSNDPPNPAFDPSTGTTGGKVLVSKRYDNPSGAVGNGTLMGSFTVSQ